MFRRLSLLTTELLEYVRWYVACDLCCGKALLYEIATHLLCMLVVGYDGEEGVVLDVISNKAGARRQ